MKVGSLFAEIGFKVDESGLEKFSNALKVFQKTIRDGLKDLKSYAKAAREISQAMREAYVPTASESRSRYRAQTAHMRSQARVNNAWARRERMANIAGAADSYLKAQRARFFEQDSNTRALNAQSRKRALDQKENGLIGTHSGKYSAGIIGILRGIAGLNIGGLLGGIAGVAGASHPIVMAITLGVKAIISAIGLVVRTIREGVRTAMAYRDYMAFTGRTTHGISGLLSSSLNTTSMRPEDVMKDVAGLEKQYWDMWFGQGNPRFWQMIGRLPTGNGEKDIMTILSSVWNLSGGLKNRGLARSLLGQSGLSEDYIPLMEDLMKENPSETIKELFERTRDQIKALEEGNKKLREWDRVWQEFKVEIARTLLDAGINDLLKELVELLRDIVAWIREKSKSKHPVASMAWDIVKNAPTVNPVLSALESIKDFIVGGGTTNNINTTVNNEVTVASTDDAVEYTTQSQYKSMADAWWNFNSADRTAPATGG